MFPKTSYGQKFKKKYIISFLSFDFLFRLIMATKRGQKFATKQSSATPGPSSVQQEDQATDVSSGLEALLDKVFTGGFPGSTQTKVPNTLK